MSTLELAPPRSTAERSGTIDLRWVLRLTGSIAFAAAIVAWMLLLRPQFLGGPVAYVMVSGTSMQPSLANGDLVVVRRQDSYEIGDVVAFRVPEGEVGAGSIVIHRIAGGSERNGFVTLGDNREAPDLWRPRRKHVVGAMWFHVRGRASALALLQTPFGLASVAGVLIFVFTMAGEPATVTQRRRRRRRLRSHEVAEVPLPGRAGVALLPPLPPRPLLPALPAPVPTPRRQPPAAPGGAPLPRPAAPASAARARPTPPDSRAMVSLQPSWGEGAWTAHDLYASRREETRVEPGTSEFVRSKSAPLTTGA